jgi:hypothetical protein
MDSEWASLNHVIIVAGHAVYVGENFDNVAADRNWYLERFQRGEPRFYIEHIRHGVDLAARDSTSLLVFSGGQTREHAGPRSEAQSYWLIAEHFRWWSQPDVARRATTEEFARDSLENVLFGICRFFECVDRYPEKVTVVSWTFKQSRFEFHRDTLRYPKDRFVFAGVNNPDDLVGAEQGEQRARREFEDDPFGTEIAAAGEPARLGDKRSARSPFKRVAPYTQSCRELAALLSHRTRDGRAFNGGLPWTAQGSV